VGSHVLGAISTEETTATMITHTPAVAKSEESKLPGGDQQGIITLRSLFLVQMRR
jgi:hypothetical protein